MNTKSQSYVVAALTVVAGIWMLAIPLMASVTGGALVTVLAIGAITVLAGIAESLWKSLLLSWVGAIAAIWLLVSSLGFDLSNAATWNMAGTSFIALILALWDGIEVDQQTRAHAHHS